jgi:hypothetical protein
VDAPGVADDNSARDAVVQHCLATADAVWMVAPIVRAVNNKTTKDVMMLSEYRRALLGRVVQVDSIKTRVERARNKALESTLRYTAFNFCFQIPLAPLQLESGYRGQLAFIATQTDALHRTEVIDNLRLDEDATKEEAASARNDFTRKRLRTDFYAGLEELEQDDEDGDEDDEGDENEEGDEAWAYTRPLLSST